VLGVWMCSSVDLLDSFRCWAFRCLSELESLGAKQAARKSWHDALDHRIGTEQDRSR
jgi:hypothetical protein